MRPEETRRVTPDLEALTEAERIALRRRVLGGWINAETKERIDVRPTHWREWEQRL